MKKKKIYIAIITIIALTLVVLSLSALAANLPIFDNMISPDVLGFLKKYGKEPNYVTEPINEIPQDNIGLDGYEYIGIHLGTYHALDSILSFIVGDMDNQFVELFRKTMDFNVHSYCRYFGITVDEFKTKYEKILSNEEFMANPIYQYKTNIKGIYGTQEEYISVFVRKGYESKVPDTCIPEGDDTHTYSYHSVPVEFAEYVGKGNYALFKKEYYGTEDFNILFFLSYFKLSREDIEVVYAQESYELKPYNLDYLFGDAQMIERYFCIHPHQPRTD